jgi:hypothetical protein
VGIAEMDVGHYDSYIRRQVLAVIDKQTYIGVIVCIKGVYYLQFRDGELYPLDLIEELKPLDISE